jgi:hypothetical protein
MLTRILLSILFVGVLSSVPGCTFDFANVDAGVGTAQSTDPFYWDDSPSRDYPWGYDWQYRQGTFRRYGTEP